MVAQMTLDHLVKVRILDPQFPFISLQIKHLRELRLPESIF